MNTFLDYVPLFTTFSLFFFFMLQLLTLLFNFLLFLCSLILPSSWCWGHSVSFSSRLMSVFFFSFYLSFLFQIVLILKKMTIENSIFWKIFLVFFSFNCCCNLENNPLDDFCAIMDHRSSVLMTLLKNYSNVAAFDWTRQITIYAQLCFLNRLRLLTWNSIFFHLVRLVAKLGIPKIIYTNDIQRKWGDYTVQPDIEVGWSTRKPRLVTVAWDQT